jgi:hypothetical protein
MYSGSRRLAHSLSGELYMVPKFTEVASTHCGRSCLYALLGSLPRSLSGKSGCIESADFLPIRDYFIQVR